ncbi:MAG TPA: hypothetical protein PLY16_03030, partial [Candidatus Saccharibacteria bacterium]|nr:hypothetical protein [Candidatus Saccharibacteria bacterium]
GQVVRHQVLVLAFGGSNPSIPAMKIVRPYGLAFFISLSGLNPRFCAAKDGRFGVVNEAKKCLHF